MTDVDGRKINKRDFKVPYVRCAGALSCNPRRN